MYVTERFCRADLRAPPSKNLVLGRIASGKWSKENRPTFSDELYVIRCAREVIEALYISRCETSLVKSSEG